jgi:hypothetical protein
MCPLISFGIIKVVHLNCDNLRIIIYENINVVVITIKIGKDKIKTAAQPKHL